MSREDLRLVEFSVTEKTKSSKTKKSVSKTKKKLGYFHIWGTNLDGKGNEKFYGLIEEAKTGKLVEVNYKNIRFLSEAELDSIFEETVEEIITEADEEPANEEENTTTTTT
ncbi:hypothetical protein E0W68_09690 [Flavobacterium salilacus subsp. salilacus]|uniref:hypothetical protein n=1 Tax=Flavobacterium TaxID=237 RepID=UPI001074AF0D|nr:MULTISPECIES: hypothetical protein [Flavobacterium]KAF2518285.1 hypothetical protein E0W68_09690 [Flavobacterium salilacus subsp. salilacus]MBE1615303.1 hypothetical protein [Flavobacterium sp. SaA2.13]NDI99589.1 hypothetical protein [Flavobacterium salilacus subsp. altitudinum]